MPLTLSLGRSLRLRMSFCLCLPLNFFVVSVSMLVDADIYNILLTLLTSPPNLSSGSYMPITFIGILTFQHYWHFSFDFRYNMEKFAGQPIDTLADSRRLVDISFYFLDVNIVNKIYDIKVIWNSILYRRLSE